MSISRYRLKFASLCAASVLALSVSFAQAEQDTKSFDIAAQPLGAALFEFSRQSDVVVTVPAGLADGKQAPAVSGDMNTDDALRKLLQGSGLDYRRGNDGGLIIVQSTAFRRGPVRIARADGDTVNDGTEREPQEDERTQLKRDEIIVTGTNIRGVSPDSSPSFVFDREDIDKTGFGTVSEFVQSLPQNFGGGSNADLTGLPNDRAASGISGSSVNLRGLGAGATLVLLNGGRLAPGGSIGDSVDISMIPLSAVERVEVLTDGASAIYGADAISGVVNFVLRDDYDGAESFVRFGSVTEGDLNEYRAGQTFGKSWVTGNALVSYEFFHRDNLGAEDRDFSSATPLPTDLLPKQMSHNVLVAAKQQLSDHVRLRGHGVYSRRDASRSLTQVTGFSDAADIEREQYGGMVGIDIDLWGDWMLDLSGGYNKLSSAIDVAGPFPAKIEIDSDLWSVDGKVDGTLFRLPGGDIKLAAGLSYREEAFSNFVNASAENQDDRTALGVFAEAFIPIIGEDNRAPGVERLELTLAGRHDDYSDFGSTTNPKLGVLWSPTDGLNFRGTYSTSFNPPNLGDTGQVLSFVFSEFLPNPASPTGTSLVVTDQRANRNLVPETSTTWTAGFDYKRDVGPGTLDFSLTWFDISFKDRIGLPTLDSFEILANPVVFADIIIVNPDPALTAALIAEVGPGDFATFAGGFFDFSGGAWMMPGDEEFIVDFRLLNLATADSSGLDINLNYVVDADIGQLNFGLNSSYLFKQEKTITSTSSVLDVVDTVFNPVDLRLRGSVSWSRDGWAASTFINYVDNYVDSRNLLGMGDLPVDSWTTVDLNLSYDTGERSTSILLDNTRFSLSVLNLFNQNPPTVESAFGSSSGFDPTNADPVGRFISFQIAKSW